tara:strand:+ start:211 stop:411 length:201 start_codon:yes stop_codon:yes gene_type:complete
MKSYIHTEILNGNKWEVVIFYDRSLRLWTVLSYRNDKQLHSAEYYNNKNELSELYDLKTFTVEGGK